jgi:hypothetical protein
MPNTLTHDAGKTDPYFDAASMSGIGDVLYSTTAGISNRQRGLQVVWRRPASSWIGRFGRSGAPAADASGDALELVTLQLRRSCSVSARYSRFRAQFHYRIAQFPHFFLKLADRRGHCVSRLRRRRGHSLRPAVNISRQQKDSHHAEFPDPARQTILLLHKSPPEERTWNEKIPLRKFGPTQFLNNQPVGMF